MTIEISTDRFSDALSTASRFVARRSALPVMKSVLLRARPDQLTIEATDLEKGARLTLPAAANIATEWSSLPTPIGWTPPFWKPSLFLPGWRAGTVAGDISVDVSEVDFFEAVQ